MKLTAKSIAALVFAALGLIAFPVAFFSQQHLFGDGAYYFADLVGTGRISNLGPDNRFLSIMITKLPTFLALHAGISNISILSWIYGATLYYFPFICYVTAALLLFRKGMDIQAALLALAYQIMCYFTSYFIISEEHLACGLFMLALSIIATCNLRNVRPLFALICIGTIAFASYESWAIFLPVCIVFFLFKVIGQAPLRPSIKFLQSAVVLIYISGSVLNIVEIFSSQVSDNRQSIIDVLGINKSFSIFFACLVFGIIVLCSCFGSTLVRIFRLDQRFIGFRIFQYLQRVEAAFPLAMLAALGASVFLYLGIFPKPDDSYQLRIINLFLPLLFALSFLAPGKKTDSSTQARTLALLCVLPMLVLTMQASLFHTARWVDFRKSFYAATQEQSGFVPIDTVKITTPSFLWGWPSPSFSILLQAMQGRNVQSILFDPKASFQPYGPADTKNALRLVKSLHLDVAFAVPNNQKRSRK